MFLNILGVLGGLVLLGVGGEALVRGSSSLALRLGISALVVGLTVVAFGTSAPELFVSLQAVLEGRGDIAAGNVLGSNVANIGLVLGLAALIRPLRVKLQVLRFDAPVLVAASVVLLAFLWDRRIDRWEGVLLAVGIVGYVAFNLVLARKQPDPEVEEEFAGEVKLSGKAWLDLLLIGGGSLVLVFGADLLVEHASSLALAIGVSEAVVGLTVVAIGTSMPEVATTVVAAVKKEADIAVGNAIGSNIFNILSIVGITGLVQPFTCPGIGWFDLGMMVLAAAVLFPMLWWGRVITRWEGALLLVGYAGYLTWLVLPGI